VKIQPDITFRQLAEQLKNRLPGSFSHLKMLPPGRLLELPSNHSGYYESAVLVLLFPVGRDIRICLIRRPASMKNHAGQIALPGGKREKDDRDLIHTALREAKEEIGIDPASIKVLGLLSSVYVQISDFLITPVLGWLDRAPEFRTDPSEVDEILFISFSDLAGKANLQEREMDTTTGRITAPGYDINGHFIWGATAMILAELDDVFSAVVSCKTTTKGQTKK
jgi:8-oxo-dGTP pyrophosphatase MutT (NUDIX family)